MLSLAVAIQLDDGTLAQWKRHPEITIEIHDGAITRATRSEGKVITDRWLAGVGPLDAHYHPLEPQP